MADETKTEPAQKATAWKPGNRTITLAHHLTVTTKEGREVLEPGTQYKATAAELEANPHMDAAHPDVIRGRVAGVLRRHGISGDVRGALRAAAGELGMSAEDLAATL